MKSLRTVIAFILSLIVLSAIGCERAENRLVSTPDDTIISISVDDARQTDLIYTGAVFVGDATDENFGNDTYHLNTATIAEDTLEISVSFSGGCRPHEFTLVVSDSFLEVAEADLQADIKKAVVSHVTLAHNANGDSCEAFPTEEWEFELTSIKKLYQQVYQQKAGTIILQLKEAPDEELIYEFAM